MWMITLTLQRHKVETTCTGPGQEPKNRLPKAVTSKPVLTKYSLCMPLTSSILTSATPNSESRWIWMWSKSEHANRNLGLSFWIICINHGMTQPGCQQVLRKFTKKSVQMVKKLKPPIQRTMEKLYKYHNEKGNLLDLKAPKTNKKNILH